MQLRTATLDDAADIAAVFSPSIRLLTFLPDLHTPEEDAWFITNVIFKACRVTCVEQGGAIIAFLALQEEKEVRLLYTHPQSLGQGAGTMLIEDAKARCGGQLDLWCFQKNTRARQFYERHGFRPVQFTDGARNEEKTPDAQYQWRRQ